MQEDRDSSQHLLCTLHIAAVSLPSFALYSRNLLPFPLTSFIFPPPLFSSPPPPHPLWFHAFPSLSVSSSASTGFPPKPSTPLWWCASPATQEGLTTYPSTSGCGFCTRCRCTGSSSSCACSSSSSFCTKRSKTLASWTRTKMRGALGQRAKRSRALITLETLSSLVTDVLKNDCMHVCWLSDAVLATFTPLIIDNPF